MRESPPTTETSAGWNTIPKAGTSKPRKETGSICRAGMTRPVSGGSRNNRKKKKFFNKVGLFDNKFKTFDYALFDFILKIYQI